MLEKLDPDQRQQYLQVLELERDVQKLRSEGKFALAIAPATQATELMLKIVGDKHPNYATCLTNLAGLYTSMGEHAKSAPYYEQALGIYKATLGEKHTPTLRV